MVPGGPGQVVGSGGRQVVEDGVVVVDGREFVNEGNDREIVGSRVGTRAGVFAVEIVVVGYCRSRGENLHCLALKLVNRQLFSFQSETSRSDV